jgi:predicted AlkP superfamily phosphohydrolase/phosphomutase
LRVKLGHKFWARRIHWNRRDGQLLPLPRIEIGPPRRRIAWKRTSAFGSLYVESRAIRLNLKGRDPQGIVSPGQEAERLLQAIADGFLALEMPDGRPMFGHVYRPEEVYDGPYASQAADLLLKPHDPSTRLLGQFTVKEMIHPLTEIRASTGNHRPTGILFARGPKVTAKTLPDAPHITDIAPTVLRALAESPTAYMDGHPLFG